MGVISSQGDAPGKPVIDRGVCTVCGICAEICPVEVLKKAGDGIAIENTNAFGCISCGQCMMVCPLECIEVTGRRLRPTDIVDLPSRETRATAVQLESLFLSRRSIRRFTDDDVSRDLIDRVVAAAATAPMGVPPWEVGITVFHGREKVRELAQDTLKGYAGFLRVFDNPLGRASLRLFMKKATWQQFESFILPLGRIVLEGARKGKDYVLYDAPVALLFHVSPYADGADAFIACTYAMLAAESLGLGSCMIGCSAPMIARRKDVLRKYGLPEGNSPKVVLILGHHKSPHRRAIRRSFQSVDFYGGSA